MADEGDKQDAQDERGALRPRGTPGQQALIWFLIIMVGVLFGMGPAIFAIRQGGPPTVFGDISQEDALNYSRTVSRVLGILYARAPEPGVQSGAEALWKGGMGEREGLMPKGEALAVLTERFLEQDVMGRKAQDIFAEFSGDRAVSRKQLERYLQVSCAMRACRPCPRPSPSRSWACAMTSC